MDDCFFFKIFISNQNQLKFKEKLLKFMLNHVR